MRKNIILSIFMIITLLVANISFAAGTPTAELTITANKTTVTSTDKTIEVTITLGNISNLVSTGSNLVLAYEGTLEYDSNMFEKVEVKGQNDWTASYEPTTKKILGDTTSAKANTVIAKLTFTLKNSVAKDATGTIKLNNIKLTDETNDFTFNKTITVTNKTQSEDPKQDKSESDENKIPDNNTIDDQNSIDKVQSKDNNTVDPSKAKGSLPKAGLKNVMILAALIIVISGVFSFARYKMIKLK